MTSLNRATTRAAAFMLAVTAVSGCTGLWVAWQQSVALTDQAVAANLLRNHMEADMMHDAVRSDVLAALAATDPASGIRREEVEADLREHLATLERTIAEDTAFRGAPAVEAATGRLETPMNAYAAAARRISGAAGSGAATAKAQLPAFFTQFRALEESMAAASDAIEAHAGEVGRSARMFGVIGMIVLAVALMLGLGAVALLAGAMRRMLVRPLLALADTMRTLGAGDLSVVVPHADRADELGDMAQAIDAFRGKLQAAEAAKEVQTRLIVDTIGGSLDAVAHGDLTAAIDAQLDGPFAGLKRSFNDALAGLRTLIGNVATGSANIRVGAGEIAQASEDLARRTERNAATLEQTNAAITEIERRIRASAAAANQTVARADTAIAVVGTGRALADDAVQAMTRVSDSAQGIDGVIEGLDKIAFQTRVLAMNAAVEAGRAGEAGRGFAVVADLVSALAMRAEEEAGRARDQLTATQTDIASAVDAVQKVDAALVDISANVDQVHALLGTMAEDNQAQSGAITQISTAIGNMDQGTQQNAAMVEETSAAARNLTEEVDALARNAAAFKVSAAGPARYTNGAGATMH